MPQERLSMRKIREVLRWGVRQGHDVRKRYPSCCNYVEAMCKRSAVAGALEAEGIAVWS